MPLASWPAQGSYRFLWLRTFHHPVAIHIWRDGSKRFLVAKQLSGAGGYDPGKVNFEHVRLLSDEQWNEFMINLEHACFWQMPTEDDHMLLNDGAQWILEGHREGHYHVVDRQSPDVGAYRNACLYLLRTSGLLKDIPLQEVY